MALANILPFPVHLSQTSKRYDPKRSTPLGGSNYQWGTSDLISHHRLNQVRTKSFTIIVTHHNTILL